MMIEDLIMKISIYLDLDSHEIMEVKILHVWIFSMNGNMWQIWRKRQNVAVNVCIYFPPVQLMSSYFQTILNFIGNPEEKWPKIGSRGHSNQTTTMFGQWQFITYSAPKLDANQTRYLQFLDPTPIDFKSRQSYSCSIIIVRNKVTNDPPTIRKNWNTVSLQRKAIQNNIWPKYLHRNHGYNHLSEH